MGFRVAFLQQPVLSVTIKAIGTSVNGITPSALKCNIRCDTGFTVRQSDAGGKSGKVDGCIVADVFLLEVSPMVFIDGFSSDEKDCPINDIGIRDSNFDRVLRVRNVSDGQGD